MRTRRVGSWLRYPMQQRANIFLRCAPILVFASFNLLVMDSSTKPLKCVRKTERIGQLSSKNQSKTETQCRDWSESPKTMKTLREAINEAVVGHLKDKLETAEGIDVAEMAHELTQSLVDIIMEQK